MNALSVPLLMAAAVTAALAGVHARRVALERASRNWPTVEGMIVDVHFGETEWYEDGDDGTTWSAHLRYQYFVGGKRYLSSRFTWKSTRGLPQKEAYGLLRGLHRGTAVIVHYDPRRPECAVVFPGVDAPGNGYTRGLIAISIALLIAAIAG